MALNYVTTLKFWEYFNLYTKIPQRNVGSSPTNEAVGTADGSASQVYYLDQENIISGTDAIYLNGVAWTRVTDFTGSGSSDTHYVIDLDLGKITFGDGTNGKAPVNTEPITAEYKYPSLDNVNNPGITDSFLTRILERAEKRAEGLCNRVWSNTTETNEVQDSNFQSDRDYFAFKKPLISLTTFQVNLAHDDEADNWKTLTEANNEIEVTLQTGRITITEPIFNELFSSSDAGNKMPPSNQRNRVRLTYQHGATAVPEDVEELVLLIGGRMLRKATVAKGQLGGRTEFNPSVIDVSKTDIMEIVKEHKFDFIRSI
jgi:hypothetical protein